MSSTHLGRDEPVVVTPTLPPQITATQTPPGFLPSCGIYYRLSMYDVIRMPLWERSGEGVQPASGGARVLGVAGVCTLAATRGVFLFPTWAVHRYNIHGVESSRRQRWVMAAGSCWLAEAGWRARINTLPPCHHLQPYSPALPKPIHYYHPSSL